MKKVIVFFFLIFVFASAFAQALKDSIVKDESRWSFGISATPIYTFHTYNYSTAYDFVKKAKWKYGIDAFSNVRLTKRINLKIGVSYTELAYIFQLGEPVFPGPNLRVDKYEYSFGNIETSFYYSIINKRLAVAVSSGIQLSFLLKNNINSCYNGCLQFSPFNNGSSEFFVAIGANVNYKINKRLKIFIEPMFLKAISPLVIHGVEYDEKNYVTYFKTNVGLIYTLGK